jgi:hypothetical protein
MPCMVPAASLGFFDIANYVEAGVWLAMSIFCATRAARTKRPSGWLLAAALLLFAASDVVEVQTGAWYRPWWLLFWKGACVLVFLTVLLPHVYRRRKRREQ